MKILEPKKGKGLCFSDIKRAMLSQGYSHTDKAITDNFKVLLEQGKIVKVGLTTAYQSSVMMGRGILKRQPIKLSQFGKRSQMVNPNVKGAMSSLTMSGVNIN